VPDVQSRFEALLWRLGQISDIERAGFLLDWDQETKMPPRGAPARAEQLATLARLAHERWTAPELGLLLEELREFEESFEPESFEASVVRVARWDYEKKRHVPSDLRAEMKRAASLGYTSWLEARAAADYELFRPHLERRIALTQEYVACHAPYDDPYDVLLDDHERGMRTAEVETVFAGLKAELVPLVAGIGEPVDDSCLHGDLPLPPRRSRCRRRRRPPRPPRRRCA
jgi:carboxypeptidase Taq